MSGGKAQALSSALNVQFSSMSERPAGPIPSKDLLLDSASGSQRAPGEPRRWRLGFWSLIVTQFQGAFNDNALKFLVIYLIVDMSLTPSERDWLVLVIGALFALPFILFSMTGGYLADRLSKRSVTIGTKWMEVGAMLFALVALARGNLMMEAAGVFLLSSQGALFGPSKYGLLPEILPERELSWGNGVIELGTFLASISATVAAGYLAYYFRGRQIWSGAALLCFTFAGLATSLGITHVPAANPGREFNPNPLGDLFTQIRSICSDRILCWAVVGNTYLWFLAALLQFTIVIYGHDILRIDDRHISYLQAAVAIGIGTGSLVTGYLSEGNIEYGLVPIGAVGMTTFGFLSASHGLSLARAGVYLGMLGFFGGFYAVPLNALIQHRPDPARKGGIIAAANLLSFVGVFLAAGAYFALAQWLHLRADQVFFAGACMTLAAAIYAVALLPDSVRRMVQWFLANTKLR
jgi:acyl-[acyl-carrier-protein]-phospholipid O-acyltransferase / long-chain-fatty-acid--[acyl-carrier-protein] ligase